MVDEETVKLRLCDFYGQNNVTEVELAIRTFREENLTQVRLLLPWYWTIAYFIMVFQFRANDHYNEVKICIAEKGPWAAKERLIRTMYRQYQIFTDHTVDEDWSIYHIEMTMRWCSITMKPKQYFSPKTCAWFGQR